MPFHAWCVFYLLDTYCANLKKIRQGNSPLGSFDTRKIFFHPVMASLLRTAASGPAWHARSQPHCRLGWKAEMSVCLTLCVSEGLRFCISCHISCLSPALLSRLPGPVLLTGFGWRVEDVGRWGLGGWRPVDKWSMSGLHFWGRLGLLGHMVGPQKRSPWMIVGTQCFERYTYTHKSCRLVYTHRHIQTHTFDIWWHRKPIFCWLPRTAELCCSFCAPACINVYLCVFVYTCVHACASKCGSVPSHPTLVAIQLLTTEGKVKVLQTKRQNVLTRASSDKRPGVWAEGRVKRK